MTDSSNPLLDLNELPRFSKITPEHVVPAVRQTVQTIESELADIESDSEISWNRLIDPLVGLERQLGKVWGPIRHLHSVANSPELRLAYEAVQGDVVAISLKMQQSEKIYSKLESLRMDKSWDQRSSAEKRVVEGRLLNARLSGVGLKGSEKETFNRLVKELTELQTKFSNNVLDSSKEFQLILKSKDQVEGLPESLLSLTAHLYNQKFPDSVKATSTEGPWLVSLDFPVYGPFMESCDRRDLREDVYRAYIKRASQGGFDNQPVLLRILQIRQEQAKLLGYSNYAELSLAKKMADKVEDVYELSESLLESGREKAFAELEEIQALAASRGFKESLKNWDLPYWAKKFQEETFQFSEEELRPYFPLPKVFHGLFELVKNIFSIEVKVADGEADVWHEDVRFFKIFQEGRGHLASFFVDPYSRPETKRGGAWMDDCVVRERIGTNITVPVAYMVCNFSPPVDSQPSLLTFREVETLFHEFGHALQHMLTQVELADVSGINGIEWDAVEIASQFMENWCYHKPTLLGMAKHFQTGETLPDALFDKVLGAKNYRAAQFLLRQIHFGLLDMDLHSRFDPFGEVSVFDVNQQIAKRASVIPPLPEDRFLCSFTHIFSGGYAAGYYSYKWAEVLSADAFSAFEDVDMNDHQALAKVGNRFRDTILGLGGSQHPTDVFRQFRGRDPSITPLLKHSGLMA